MRPLRIALLSRSYWLENHLEPDGEGGPTQQLAEAVAALGHEVVVMTHSFQARKPQKSNIGPLETWFYPREKHRNALMFLRDRWARKAYSHPQIYTDALALRDFLALRGPFDVLWAPSESPDGLVVAVAAQLGVKLPPVLLQVEGLRVYFEKGAPVFIDKRPLGLAFRHAARILACSELVAKVLPAYAGRGLTVENLNAKVHVVYPNIQRAFLQAARQNPSVPAPMPDRVLFLGELSQHKGAFLFLKAVPKTQASKRNSTFTVIGDFAQYKKLLIRRWEEAQEEARVQILGARMEYLDHVSVSEVIRQIKLARVVVIPALFDAFSRGVVEALVLGRPVITTDKVGAAALVRAHDCGIVIPANDSAALAHAIDVVLSPIVPFVAKAQHAGQQLFHDFSPEAVALRIAHHLSEIAR
ncbi:MAG TPA: glycosyltransferase family 4 protein [Candidatus Methylacidiphilales bacterium]|jgi:glycosyltransferase involved in cell wall biosynthesis|nr:glycosyltransferase family 4 protein [Candidatus Methylacidiphilales bacterium]